MTCGGACVMICHQVEWFLLQEPMIMESIYSITQDMIVVGFHETEG